jgi:hypothetical protein
MTSAQNYLFDSANQVVSGKKPENIDDYIQLKVLLLNSVRGIGYEKQIILILMKSFGISEAEARSIARFIVDKEIENPAAALNIEKEQESPDLPSNTNEHDDNKPGF